jgi:hypothetical protein
LNNDKSGMSAFVLSSHTQIARQMDSNSCKI